VFHQAASWHEKSTASEWEHEHNSHAHMQVARGTPWCSVLDTSSAGGLCCQLQSSTTCAAASRCQLQPVAVPKVGESVASYQGRRARAATTAALLPTARRGWAPPRPAGTYQRGQNQARQTPTTAMAVPTQSPAGQPAPTCVINFSLAPCCKYAPRGLVRHSGLLTISFAGSSTHRCPVCPCPQPNPTDMTGQ